MTRRRSDLRPVSASCECGREFLCLMMDAFWDEISSHRLAFPSHTISVEWSDGMKGLLMKRAVGELKVNKVW